MKAYNKLLELVNNESVLNSQFSGYTLDSITRLLEIFNNPQDQIKTVHIAGSNGKGSVAHYLNSIMINAGYITGLFTSPHLLKINERICINSDFISDTKLETYSEELFSVLTENKHLKPTFFDALTLFAFRYFCDNKVDCAIIETGLGGRLDSTNTIVPECALITDISLEHTQVLGNTITEITREKSGIIKNNSTLFTSNTHPQVISVLKETVLKKSAQFFRYEIDFTTSNVSPTDEGDYSFDYHASFTPSEQIVPDIRTTNPGHFQVINSSLAISAALFLREKQFSISNNNIKNGIAKTVIPGRMQVLLQDPMLVYDPAHNPVSLKAVLHTMGKKYTGKQLVIIASFMKDKEYQKMFHTMQKHSSAIIYYNLDDPRSVPSDELINKNTPNPVYTVDNPEKLLQHIKRLNHSDSIFLFTGTFRLYEYAYTITNRLSSNKES